MLRCQSLCICFYIIYFVYPANALMSSRKRIYIFLQFIHYHMKKRTHWPKGCLANVWEERKVFNLRIEISNSQLYHIDNVS